MSEEFNKISKTDEEWRKELTAEEFLVTRQAGTERPFSGIYWNETREGVYACKCCDLPLFSSGTKFDAGCGWPSFYEAFPGAVDLTVDKLYVMAGGAMEVRCHDCGGHLGHRFTDGGFWDTPTGFRYCMNGVALAFEPAADSGAA